MAKIGAALVAALMLIVSWRVIGRMASRFLRFWRALPLLGKIVLPVCLTVFYIEFTYGNVPTDGFTSFVKLKNKTLDLTGNVAPNRTVRVEKNFEQDTEWWLENYPEICYTNATGNLIFDYDTNEWFLVEFTFGAAEPLAAYNRDLDNYRRRVYDALGGLTDVDDCPQRLVGEEFLLDRWNKTSMPQELLDKYEPLFKTVTNINDAVVEKFITYVWDGCRETRKEFLTKDLFESFVKESESKFLTVCGPSITWVDKLVVPSTRIQDKAQLKINKQYGLESGAVTNYYRVHYYDPYLLSNILGPRPQLSQYYKRSPLLFKNKKGETISPDFHMDFPLKSNMVLLCRDGPIFVRKNESQPYICDFIKAGYVYMATSDLPCQGIRNPQV